MESQVALGDVGPEIEPAIEPPGAESPPLEDEWAESGSAEESDEPIEGLVEESTERPVEARASETDDEGAAESADDEDSEWEAVAAAPSSEPTPLTKKSAARRKQRPSVPSWDDIMFGTKRD